jgi:hypothetical protein
VLLQGEESARKRLFDSNAADERGSGCSKP